MQTTEDKSKRTVAYYDREAANWAAVHGGNEGDSYWKEEMEKFHQLLPSGKVLEVGSGAGKDAAALIRMGYDYIGTDASKGLIEIAQQRNPTATFRNVAAEELDFPKASFDGFWTTATLLHIPKDRIDKAIQSIKRVIKRNGVGFISVKAGAGESEDTSTGRWFSYYSQDGFGELLTRNGFKIVEQETRKGEKDYWLLYYVRNYP